MGRGDGTSGEKWSREKGAGLSLKLTTRLAHLGPQPLLGPQAGPLSSSDIFYCCTVCVSPDVQNPIIEAGRRSNLTQFSDGDIEAEGEACPGRRAELDGLPCRPTPVSGDLPLYPPALGVETWAE